MKLIIEKEITLHQFEVRTDKAQLLTLLHPDFKEVGESGNSYNLKTIISLLGGEQPDGSHIHSQDYEASKLAGDVYLLTYRSVSIDADGEHSHYAKRSSIWVLNNEQWQMKYHQGTPCQPFIISI